jgi:hypothetical protein
MADIERIERNVRKMIDMKAPEAEIDGYLSTEGMTPQRFRESMLVKKAPKDKRPGADTGVGRMYYGVSDALKQGMTLGFSDELAGFAGGVGSLLTGEGYSTGYESGRDTERARLKEFKSEHPVAATTAEVAGGFLTAAPVATGAAVGTPAWRVVHGAATQPAIANPALSTAGGIARSAGAGAVMGGAAGFGSAEGGVEDRLAGAGIGATLGGVLGGGIPLVAAAARPIVGKVAHALGLRDAGEKARMQLLRAFERDGITPEDALRRLNDWQMQGAKPEMLIDLGGENVRGLARAAAGVPGEAKNRAVEVLTTRQGGQAARVGEDVAQAYGRPGNFYDVSDDLMRARTTQAAPLYQQAFERHTAVSSDRLRELLDDPVMRDGLRRGLELQRIEARARGQQFRPNDYAITNFDDAGNPVMGEVPNLRLLDAAKRGLDDILSEARAERMARGTPMSQRERAIDEFRHAYVAEIDNLLGGATSPDNLYAQARAAWSGPSRSLDAMNLGRRIFNEDAEITARAIQRLPEGDREFFRAGVVQALRDKINNTQDGSNVVRSFFRNQAMRDKLAATFDNPQDFRRFQAALEREGRMFQNARDVSPRTGSQTDPRGREIADMEIDPVVGSLIDSVSQGQTLWGSTMNALRGAANYSRGQSVNSATATELAPIMFNPLPSGNQNALAELSRLRDDQIRRILASRPRVNRLTSGAATASGLVLD